MTTPVLFLLGAVALSALGGLVVWVLSRPRPERFGSSIETFHRDLDALAPPGRAKPNRAPRQRPSTPHQQMPPVKRPGSEPTAHKPAAKTPAKAPANRWGVTQTSPRPRPGPRPKQDG